MKKIVYALLVTMSTAFALSSCSPKTNSTPMNVNRSAISGNWSLNNITFDNISESNIKTFLGEPSYKCFIGSIWNLTNSGNGEYLIPNNEYCSAKTQDIFWSYNSTDAVFQYKILNEGDRAKNVTDGFKLLVASNNGSEMTIKSPISYNGGTAYVNLHFQKVTR
ncbi:MAG: hypothetical protein EOO99_09125 [Pedobacter sp.]|nr:MAG: hypothetical protein EOO99_09125 [Pedobacter sp.]